MDESDDEFVIEIITKDRPVYKKKSLPKQRRAATAVRDQLASSDVQEECASSSSDAHDKHQEKVCEVRMMSSCITSN